MAIYKSVRNNPKLMLSLGGVIIFLLIIGYRIFSAGHSSTGQPSDVKVVEVETVALKDIQQTIRLIGTIKPKMALLLAKAPGILTILHQAGDIVSPGTVIAKIGNLEIERRYLLAQSKEAINKAQYERIIPLEKSGHISKGALEQRKRDWLEAQQQLAEAKNQLDNIRLYAPFNGTIGVYKARDGAHVKVEDVIVSFYDPTSLIVEFSIPSSVMPFIKENQAVSINGVTYPLTRVQRMIDEETHMSPAYVNYPCSDCVIGTDIDVDLTVHDKKQVVVVPYEAVFLRDGKTHVYCVEENQAAPVPVELGIRNKDLVEITDGLSSGDVLIKRGHTRLYPYVPVQIAKPSSSGQK